MSSAGKGHIRNQNKNGGKKLQQSSVNAGYVFNEFVQQDNSGIKYCGAQSTEDAHKVLAAAGACSGADNHKQSNGRHAKADELLFRKSFMKKKRAGCSNDHRGKIIA